MEDVRSLKPQLSDSINEGSESDGLFVPLSVQHFNRDYRMCASFLFKWKCGCFISVANGKGCYVF